MIVLIEFSRTSDIQWLIRENGTRWVSGCEEKWWFVSSFPSFRIFTDAHVFRHHGESSFQAKCYIAFSIKHLKIVSKSFFDFLSFWLEARIVCPTPHPPWTTRLTTLRDFLMFSFLSFLTGYNNFVTYVRRWKMILFIFLSRSILGSITHAMANNSSFCR